MELITEFDYEYHFPTAVALGTFDGVHLGHRAVIEAAVEAGRRCKLAPAVFTFSTLPKNAFLKDSERVWPLCSAREKEALLASLGVDSVVMLPFDERISRIPAEEFIAEMLIERLRARYIVCGIDHRFGAGAEGDSALIERICKRRGLGFTFIEPVCMNGVKISSTLIRSLMEEGRIEDARELLGHEI